MASQEEAIMPAWRIFHPATARRMMAATDSEADWQYAKFMSALDADLKSIVATAFDRNTYNRLSMLQAEARRLSWQDMLTLNCGLRIGTW